jgi:hypothetical protein
VRPALLALPAALAVALTGCAGQQASSAGNFKGDQKAVAQTLDDLAKAARDGDEKTVCTQILARALVSALDAHGGCRPVVYRQLKQADLPTLDVKSVAVHGRAATARVTSKVSGHDQTQTVTLVNEAGRWRVSGLG